MFVAFADDLEEELGAAFVEGQVSELVEDEEAWGFVASDLLTLWN